MAGPRPGIDTSICVSLNVPVNVLTGSPEVSWLPDGGLCSVAGGGGTVGRTGASENTMSSTSVTRIVSEKDLTKVT